jgi:hypothetical protein
MCGCDSALMATVRSSRVSRAVDLPHAARTDGPPVMDHLENLLAKGVSFGTAALGGGGWLVEGGWNFTIVGADAGVPRVTVDVRERPEAIHLRIEQPLGVGEASRAACFPVAALTTPSTPCSSR